MRMLEGGDEPGPETLPVVRRDLVNRSYPVLDGERALRVTAVGSFYGATGNLFPDCIGQPGVPVPFQDAA